MEKQLVCEAVSGLERPDDPLASPWSRTILERYEASLLGVLSAEERTTAMVHCREFSAFARARTRDESDVAFVRRLELSNELQVLLAFDDDSAAASRVAAELVACPVIDVCIS